MEKENMTPQSKHIYDFNIVETVQPKIEKLIYVIRGKQVMTDSDLAMLYQVETSALNRAVKRNIKRFPEDFHFQLTEEEYDFLRCQIGISKTDIENKVDGRGGRRYLPYVFTEQGISKADRRKIRADICVHI